MIDKWLQRLVWLAPILLLLEIGVRPIFEPDLFFYFALAEHYLKTGAWVTNDPFVYTLPNDPLMTLHQWLGYWLFYIPYLLMGWAGPILVKTIMIMAFFFLPLIPFYFSRRPVPPALALAWSVAVFIGHHRIRERVSLFGDFFALALSAGLLWRSQSRWFWRSLPVLFLTWAQIHPSYPLGLVILLVFCLCDWRLVREMGAWRWMLAAVAVTIVHPLGMEGLLYPFTFSVKIEPYLSHHVMEWLPLWDQRIFPYVFLYLPLITFIPWITWRFSLRRGLRQSFIIALFMLAIILMVKSVRFGLLAQGIFLLILVEQERLEPIRLRWQPSWLIAAICAGLVWYKADTSPWVGRPLGERIGIDQIRLPVEATELLTRARPRMRIFNSFAYGGYLAWRWQGQPPVFYHGFSTNFRFFEDNYLEPMTSQEKLEALIREFDLGVFILTKTGYDGDYIELLSRNERWQRLFEDAGTVIFIKRDPRVF
jgi:hypothetical protein